MPRRESRGSQAPLIERMGAVLGPPRCFAKMDGGALFVWLCPPQWSLSKRRPGRGHSLKVNARPTTGSSALPASSPAKCCSLPSSNVDFEPSTSTQLCHHRPSGILFKALHFEEIHRCVFGDFDFFFILCHLFSTRSILSS